MTTPNIYPFTLRPFDSGPFATSNELAKRLWLNRPKDVAPKQLYYATGLVVTGPTSVKVQVFGMLCNVRGGVGALEFEYVPETLSPGDRLALDNHIEERQTLYAAKEFERREKARKAAQIEAIRKELFDVQPGATP